tara:strand:+ start:1999 stop:2478 length:480 start_codon:yes stop_codon:yes gene_type:complete
MKKIVVGKSMEKRAKLIKNQELYFNQDHETQKILINKFYLDLSFNEKNIMRQELRSKQNGYRQQDIDKKIYNEKTFITLESISEKLMASKLICLYCKEKIKIFYENIREPLQWTLDRKNNNLDHSDENTIICCLKCNLQRRKKNMEAFRFTKQLKIVKK